MPSTLSSVSNSSKFETDEDIVGSVTIKDYDGNDIQDDDLIKNGYYMFTEENSKILLIVKGDVNCDGLADLGDILEINKNRLGKNQFHFSLVLKMKYFRLLQYYHLENE